MFLALCAAKGLTFNLQKIFLHSTWNNHSILTFQSTHIQTPFCASELSVFARKKSVDMNLEIVSRFFASLSCSSYRSQVMPPKTPSLIQRKLLCKVFTRLCQVIVSSIWNRIFSFAQTTTWNEEKLKSIN